MKQTLAECRYFVIENLLFLVVNFDVLENGRPEGFRKEGLSPPGHLLPLEIGEVLK